MAMWTSKNKDHQRWDGEFEANAIRVKDDAPVLRLQSTGGSNPIESGTIQFSEGGEITTHFTITYNGSTNKLRITSTGSNWEMARDTGNIVQTGGTYETSQFISNVTTGTAPLTVASTTKVTNLNADLLDGKDTGTSGNKIPLLDGINTWSALQTHSPGTDTAQINLAEVSNQFITPSAGDMWHDSYQGALFDYISGVAASYPRVLFTQTATGTVSNTTTATSVISTGIGTVSLPANFLTVGKTIKITWYGYIGTATLGGTLNFTSSLGGTNLISETSNAIIAGSTNQAIEGEHTFTCRSVGSSGTVFAQGSWLRETSLTASQINFAASTAAVTVNTTGTLAIDLKATWASLSNDVNITNLTVEVLN